MSAQKELAIIGAGIAGVCSAVYAKRAGIDFFLFESKTPGGQLLFMEHVDNYVGVEPAITGSQLAQRLGENLRHLEIEICKEEISRIALDNNALCLSTATKEYETRSLIIATGAVPQTLGVKGEERLRGRGVSYCAVCDGFFFRNKRVAVVGGGNTAVEEALYLSDIVQKVYLIHRRDSLRALDYLQKELSQKKNVEIVFNTVVKDIKGADFLEEVVFEDTRSHHTSTLSISGLFIAIGIRPSTDQFRSIVKTDERGFILTNEMMKTSRDGIWACGDCRRRPLRQLVTAASEGAIAVLSVYHYLRGYYISA